MKFLLVLTVFLFIFNPIKIFAAIVGDVNSDNRVDIIDIGIIIDNYGKTPIPNIKADINSDGGVNIIDIGLVIDNYGKTTTATSTPSSGKTYKVAAIGDMVCGTADVGLGYPCQAGATGNTIRQINPDTVLLLGDNQYESGSLSDFNKYYEPLYGSFKNITRPVPGNHEYGTPGAAGYFTYFGSLASPMETNCKNNCKGYYSFDLGNWHLIALNSECDKVGGCGIGSAQLNWLKSDLGKVPDDKCILAYWHEARFSSGHGGNDSNITSRTTAFWQELYKAKADLILNGHSHSYERFDLQDASGNKDSQGIRQFVVGSGGRDLTGFWNNSGISNSQIKNNNTFGVLKLLLNQNSYEWQFIASTGINGYKNGSFTDSGLTSCH